MDNHTYWTKQTDDKPLFPELAWSKPEHRSARGKLGIIGGQKNSFLAVSDNYRAASEYGVGEVKLVLPESLKRDIAKYIEDVIYSPATQSGGFSKLSEETFLALSDWSQAVILIGDLGKNSETAIAVEYFVAKDKGPIIITRDAVDLLLESASELVNRQDTVLVVSFSQLQKLFQKIYYPVVLTHSMNTVQLVEAIHKFTISYPTTIALVFQNQIFIADNGLVTSTPLSNPMSFIKGNLATKMAAYWLWYPNKKLAALTASIL